MTITTRPRLSPYNITDDLIRANLYKEIRQGQVKDNDWTPHEIQLDEILMPELIAYRRYGTDQLKWVILIAAGLDDMREPLDSGTVIKLPPVMWIRERIKFYVGEDEA